MSFIYLLAADTPLPLCDRRMQRTVTKGLVSFSGKLGFAVEPCTYYPYEIAHCATKPHCYALSLVQDTPTHWDLTAYLSAHLPSESEVQLWHTWLENEERRNAPPRYRGSLCDLDWENFSLLFGNDELCLTIKI